MEKDKQYVDNDVFVFRLGLPWELANLEIPIYTNPSPKEWNDDYNPGLTLDKKEEMVEKAYFTPERIKELKQKIIKKIEECENPFEHISCTDVDGGYNVTEDELFYIEWVKPVVPKTVEEAILALDKMLVPEDKEYLLTEEKAAIMVHHTLGRWIRNNWGLWGGSELKDVLAKQGIDHPDDMSHYIIEEYIKHYKK